MVIWKDRSRSRKMVARQHEREKINMKKLMITMTALASALVLMFPGAVTADTGRTVEKTFEFYAIGQGDVGGFCLNEPDPTDPPELAQFQSCARAAPADPSLGAVEDHVGITVVDAKDQPVYFSVQQNGNPNFAGGCGKLEWGDVVTHPTHPGELLFPIEGAAPGGGQAADIVVFPWAGPGLNTVPGGAACPGSTDLDHVESGVTGTVTFTFHNLVTP